MEPTTTKDPFSSVMTPEEVAAYFGKTVPSERADGIGLRLIFTVTCPYAMEDETKEAVAAALDALGLHDRHYNREKVQ